jgi:hypothetical protein
MKPVPPTVFISYSHDSEAHRRIALELAERLRQDGIDAQIDQYVEGTPVEGWPRWMLNRLGSVNFVLVICTDTYYRRFRGQEEAGHGRGVDWEGSLITFEIYTAKSSAVKFVPVCLRQSDIGFVPEPLRGATIYILDSEENYGELYAFLTGQAGVRPGDLGALKTLTMPEIKPLTFGERVRAEPVNDDLRRSNSGYYEMRQQGFVDVARRIPTMIDASYLQRCQMQITDGLCEAECGATFAMTLGDKTKEETLGLISNGIKKFRMTLPAQVKQMVLSLAKLSDGAHPELLEFDREYIRGHMHPALCGWVLVDALRNKDLLLLRAVRALGIDAIAVDSFAHPYLPKWKLQDLPAALKILF